MSRSFEMRTSGLIIGAVIAAGLTSLALVGDYSYFGFTATRLPIEDWSVRLICGILGGLARGLFTRIVVAFANGLPGKIGRLIKGYPIPFAMPCGLGVA